jgi:hypothetical protein
MGERRKVPGIDDDALSVEGHRVVADLHHVGPDGLERLAEQQQALAQALARLPVLAATP